MADAVVRSGAVPAQSGPAAADRDRMPEVDFAQVFDNLPAPLLLITPDFTIVHANKARVNATRKPLEEQIGRNLFEVFPPNPDDPESDGTENLRAALLQEHAACLEHRGRGGAGAPSGLRGPARRCCARPAGLRAGAGRDRPRD